MTATPNEPEPDTPADAQAVAARVVAAGQGHLLAHADELPPPMRAPFLASLAEVDWTRFAAAVASAPPGAPPDLRPPEALTLRRRHNQPGLARRLRAAGEAALRAGRVATVLLAGGQGSRLGHPGPKGTFVLGPSPDRTLYAILAERVGATGRRAGAPVPFVVLTSRDTDEATRDAFVEPARFGLDADALRFVRQGELPAVDDEGRALLSGPGRLALAPDGHGGLLAALERAGTFTWLAARGVEWLTTFQVDNPLGRPLDPELLGWALERRAVAAGKAVRKAAPGEKVGVFARGLDGRLRIVEYSELPAEGAEALGLGSIAVHAWHLPWLRTLVGAAGFGLPWHRARRTVLALSAGAVVPTPATKLEQFLFDLLPLAERTALLEVERAREFAPVKNATGDDSPATARALVAAELARWHRVAGRPSPAGAADLRPLEADGPEDLAASR